MKGSGTQDNAAGEQVGGRRKSPRLRRSEILGSGEGSLGTSLLSQATTNLKDWIESPTASDCIVELASGAAEGMDLPTSSLNT